MTKREIENAIIQELKVFTPKINSLSFDKALPLLQKEAWRLADKYDTDGANVKDEIDEQIYQCIRNNYSAEMLILLSKITGITISELLRIHCIQKSEKPGGIYFNKPEEMESFLLNQVLELGFELKKYRWCYKGILVRMGEFLHNPDMI